MTDATKDPSFQGRRVVVVGGSSGIGLAITRMFAASSAVVMATSHASDPTELRGVTWTNVDLSKPARVTEFSSQVEDFRPDILVYSAAVLRDRALINLDQQDFDDVLQVGLLAIAPVAKAALSEMIRTRWGRIVLIGSAVRAIGNPSQTNYCAAKSGMVGFARSLAREVGPRGVTVNVIEPGLIDTPLVRARGERWWTDMTSAIPMGRAGTPDEVATTVAWLCGDTTGQLTGQTIAVDGGLLAAARR